MANKEIGRIGQRRYGGTIYEEFLHELRGTRGIASFVSMMILATGGTDNTATQVTALIMAGASVVAYIIGEGLTDSANIGSNSEDEE